MKLKIKEAIPAEVNPTLTYKVHIKSMHGDADAFTEQSKLINAYDDVIKYLKFLTTVWTMKGNQYNHKEVQKAIREAATELDLDGHAEDIWMDLVDFDQTNDQHYAYVDEIWVTYFDNRGIEFNVEIELKDKVHKKITKYRYTGNRF